MKHSEETEFESKLRSLAQKEKEQLRCRTIEKEKLAAILRSLVQYEALQAHRRISWLGTLQGLLFASLAFGWDKNANLSKWTAYLGITFSVLVFAGLLAGVEFGKRIRKIWRDFGPEGGDPTEVFGFYPDKHPRWVYAAPEVIMPAVFVIAWGFILHFIPPDSPKKGSHEIGRTNCCCCVSIASPSAFAGTNRPTVSY